MGTTTSAGSERAGAAHDRVLIEGREHRRAGCGGRTAKPRHRVRRAGAVAESGAVGGGLHIWTNGSKALDWLGTGERVRGAGEAMNLLQFRRWDGAVLVNAPVGELGRKYGSRTFFVPRVEVPRALLAAADGIDVRWGAGVGSVSEDDQGVTAQLADGSELRGSVLLGADGIDSGVRRQILGEIEPRYVGLGERARVSAALEAWAGGRRPSVSLVVKRSRQIGTLGLWRSPLGGMARDVFLRAIGPILIRQMGIDFREALPV
jgi:2-polyprenyl-6-methoxyphenol hydroxylase-like FAD-dependent oxidoreductase